jgi:hypothetical protein
MTTGRINQVAIFSFSEDDHDSGVPGKWDTVVVVVIVNPRQVGAGNKRRWSIPISNDQ